MLRKFLLASAHCWVPKPLTHISVPGTLLPGTKNLYLSLSPLTSRGDYSNIFKASFCLWRLLIKLYSCFMSIHFYFLKWYCFRYLILFPSLFNHHYAFKLHPWYYEWLDVVTGFQLCVGHHGLLPYPHVLYVQCPRGGYPDDLHLHAIITNNIAMSILIHSPLGMCMRTSLWYMHTQKWN